MIIVRELYAGTYRYDICDLIMQIMDPIKNVRIGITSTTLATLKKIAESLESGTILLYLTVFPMLMVGEVLSL